MWTYLIQMVLTEIEEQIKLLGIKYKSTIIYNEAEIKEYNTSLLLVDEFRTLILRMNWDDNNEEGEKKGADKVIFSLEGLPIIEGIAGTFGIKTVGKLVSDVSDEIKESRAVAREIKLNEQENRHNKQMVNEVKDLDGDTELNITRRDGRGFNLKNKKPAKKGLHDKSE